MRFPRLLKEKLLIILISRTAFFFFLMCLVTIFLYVAGTIQNFIDSTQIFILKFYVILGIFLVTFSFCGVIIGIKRFIDLRKRRYLLRAGGYLLFVLFGIVTILAVIFILTITGGNSGPPFIQNNG